MKIEDINKAIAEACGWKNIHWYEDNAGPGFWSGIPYISEEDVFKLDARKLRHLREYGDKIPNYCADLNAMHEAEKILFPDQWEKYGLNLETITEANHRSLWSDIKFILIHATAPQRAEAFLRTIGKWVE